MSTRPFRHLCPEADLRDAMTDDEFWDHVLQQPEPEWVDDGPVLIADSVPCRECGEVGACAYDAEGRPLIHAEESSDDR